MLKNSLQAPFLVTAAFKWKPLTNFTFDTSGDTKRARDALGERMGGCLFITNFWFYLNLSFGPWRRFVFKLKYWANLFKYIFLFYSFVYFFIALPFHIFLHVVIVLIQVYSWEIRHHSLVCCCGLANFLYILESFYRALRTVWPDKSICKENSTVNRDYPAWCLLLNDMHSSDGF